MSGAKISDATQVMQSTITPASEPTSNINEKRFGKEPKTVDQARRGVCLYPPDAHLRPRDHLTHRETSRARCAPYYTSMTGTRGPPRAQLLV